VQDNAFRVFEDRAQLPDRVASRAAMAAIIRAMPERVQQTLKRFYLQGHKEEDICHEMQLSELQFISMKEDLKRKWAQARTLRKRGDRDEPKTLNFDAIGRLN